MAHDIQKLRTIINENNWNHLIELVKPKQFSGQDSGELPDIGILAQICQILISDNSPEAIKILCLKCLGNSCFAGYKHKQYISENIKSDKYNKNIYNELIKNSLHKCEKDSQYSHNIYFPYDGVAEYAVDYIIAYNKSTKYLNDNELDILRLAIQFLCNLFTYACQNMTTTDNVIILKCLKYESLKEAIIYNTQSNHTLLISAACIYVHNAFKKLYENYFTDDEKNHLCSMLLKPSKEGFTSARDALLHLLHCPNMFKTIYSTIAINEKIDLLEIIYEDIWQTLQTDDNIVLGRDTAEFLALTFCRRSDLILKTINTYVNDINPTEVILILNILGLLTSVQHAISQNARPLIINCKYLLMSLHLVGKESDNYFTPIKKLSDMVPSAQRKTVNTDSTTSDINAIEECDFQDHPAYGFKVGIIKVIGNMVYRNKMCQDLFREIDGIPLLLDCCNIDARNPLILQWTILALRNLCEGNVENQTIIKNCKKEGLVDNPVLQEMGLTLHEEEDGKSIRIAPLHQT